MITLLLFFAFQMQTAPIAGKISKPAIVPIPSEVFVQMKPSYMVHWISTITHTRCGLIRPITDFKQKKIYGWAGYVNSDEYGVFASSTFTTKDAATSYVESYCPSH